MGFLKKATEKGHWQWKKNLRTYFVGKMGTKRGFALDLIIAEDIAAPEELVSKLKNSKISHEKRCDMAVKYLTSNGWQWTSFPSKS